MVQPTLTRIIRVNNMITNRIIMTFNNIKTMSITPSTNVTVFPLPEHSVDETILIKIAGNQEEISLTAKMTDGTSLITGGITTPKTTIDGQVQEILDHVFPIGIDSEFEFAFGDYQKDVMVTSMPFNMDDATPEVMTITVNLVVGMSVVSINDVADDDA